MNLSPAATLLVMLLLTGCVSTAPPAAVVPPVPVPQGTTSEGTGEPVPQSLAPPPAAIVFAAPIRLTTQGPGFEPSLKVTPGGMVAVTAHKGSYLVEKGRLASWAWDSVDDGATFQDLPSPANIQAEGPGIEGDLAVDGLGRLYMVDTYEADATLSRWSAGPAWDFTRPVLGSSGTDDRPFLAAQGDGRLYYLQNNGVIVPAPDGAAAGSAQGARIWFFASTDAGLTWSLGMGFPDAHWCYPAAPAHRDGEVHVACLNSRAMEVEDSTDGGKTWTATAVAPFQPVTGAETDYPGAAADPEGTASYVAWTTQAGNGTLLHWARSLSANAWRLMPPVAIPGCFQRAYLFAGPGHQLAALGYATAETQPTAASDWRPVVLLQANATGSEAAPWTWLPIDQTPAARGPEAPRDLLQGAFGPNGDLHVAWQRDGASPLPMDLYGRSTDVYYAHGRPTA